MKIKAIVLMSLAIAALAAAALAAPFARDAMVRGTALDRSWPVPALDISTGGHTRRRVEPLGCADTGRERLRLYAAYCRSEHLVDVDLHSGDVVLATGLAGEFRTKEGQLVREHWQLSPAIAQAMRVQVASRLPGLARDSECCTLPASEEAIEACVDGRSMIAVRHEPTDDGFHALFGELVDGTGLQLANSQPDICL